jgi:hypothetical protein
VKATAGTPAAQYTGNRRDDRNVGNTNSLQDFICSKDNSNSRDFSFSKIPGTLIAVRITRAAGPTAAQEIFRTAGNPNNSRTPKLVETE